MTITNQPTKPIKAIIPQEEVEKRRLSWERAKGNMALSGFNANKHAEQWATRFIYGYQDLQETIEGFQKLAEGKIPLKKDKAPDNEG